MNVDPTEPPKWSPTLRWILILVVFVAHIGLIFALGDKKPLKPRQPPPGISLTLAPGESELLALNNAALLALPQRQGFAGAAWLKAPEVEFQPFRWTEPSRELPLRLEELGAAFNRFMQTNSFASMRFEIKPVSDVPTPPRLAPAFATPTNSHLLLSDEIDDRRLLNPPTLQPIPATDLLTNTVVQVLVTAEGDVLSYTLLSRSGSPDADQRAMEIARTAHFDRQRSAPALTKGALIFEWLTAPASPEPRPKP